ncbi:MAG: FtsW/RodA/SpoVE family cell cycle protein, partial [Planctomycetota bacterium]|nr:FtsW/RodA/SpoVE family cell cycle protein [Planctomycetota bacterium]
IANETGLLPERDCDSIIAVIAEEAGFIGTASLIVLYSLMVALLMIAASRLRDRYGRLVVGGVAIYFGAHLVINVSVNLGLLPMTGLTLPLLSTGGSSQLATFLALGLALGLASHHERSLGGDAFREF